MGGLDGVVAGVEVHVAREVGEFVEDALAVGMVERQAGTGRVVDREQVELPPEFPVIALLGLAAPFEIRLHLRLALEGRPVDAGERVVVLVAPPVRGGDVEEFERADLARRLDVRALTEILELPLPVDGDGILPRRLRLEDVPLVRVVGVPL